MKTEEHLKTEEAAELITGPYPTLDSLANLTKHGDTAPTAEKVDDDSSGGGGGGL